MFKAIAFIVTAMIPVICSFGQQSHSYEVKQTFHISSPGGWDYIAVDGNKLYVSHGTQVNILDKNTGDSITYIPNTTGVHGIAFDHALNKGYTSNGRLNNVTVFDLNTGKELHTIATGQNPDAIIYDSYSKTIITCNGRTSDLSIIDPVKETVIHTIPVGGRPETAVSDDAGKLFVNIEDKSEIVQVNTKTFKVEKRWSIAPGEAPTGLAYDKSTKKLFAGCDNKLLMVIDATNGKVVSKVPIGDGCDGVAFDAGKKMIFTSNGDGTLTIISEKPGNQFKVVQNLATKKGARTLVFDKSSQSIFLPTADFEPVSDTSKARPKMVAGTFQVLVVQ